MMRMVDWFRNTSWSEAIEEEFFRRLSRARSQRDQYLFIQALTLARIRPEISLRLVDIYFDTRSNDFYDICALQAKAEALATTGDLLAAAETYKSVLEREKMRPGHMTSAYLDYPFLVATERLASEYEQGLTVLEDRRANVAFPLGRFRWNAAYALILSAMGDVNAARDYALAAVEAAREQSSEFRNHRELGLVDASYEPLIERLQELSR
jgi:hypothetical protein